MTSNINPNNINGAYPVAGQDNNSQGFRDNFTNTSTNFQYAANEITDLQNKAVLKAALTGTTLNNDMLGSVLSNAQLQNMSSTSVPLGTLTGTVTVNYAAGSYQTVTTGGNISLAFTNFPAAGVLASVAVQITVTNATFTVTLPAAVTLNTTGVQGLNTSTRVMTFAAAGTYVLLFSTSDGGASVTLNQTNAALTPFNASSQSVATTNAVVSLSSTATYFTLGGLTATLANGVSGQTKTIVAAGNIANVGNTTITVAAPGWTGAGNIVLSARGQGCTLQFVNGAWYCVGNNGLTFN